MNRAALVFFHLKWPMILRGDQGGHEGLPVQTRISKMSFEFVSESLIVRSSTVSRTYDQDFNGLSLRSRYEDRIGLSRASGQLYFVSNTYAPTLKNLTARPEVVSYKTQTRLWQLIPFLGSHLSLSASSMTTASSSLTKQLNAPRKSLTILLSNASPTSFPS